MWMVDYWPHMPSRNGALWIHGPWLPTSYGCHSQIDKKGCDAQLALTSCASCGWDRPGPYLPSGPSPSFRASPSCLSSRICCPGSPSLPALVALVLVPWCPSRCYCSACRRWLETFRAVRMHSELRQSDSPVWPEATAPKTRVDGRHRQSVINDYNINIPKTNYIFIYLSNHTISYMCSRLVPRHSALKTFDFRLTDSKTLAWANTSTSLSHVWKQAIGNGEWNWSMKFTDTVLTC